MSTVRLPDFLSCTSATSNSTDLAFHGKRATGNSGTSAWGAPVPALGCSNNRMEHLPCWMELTGHAWDYNGLLINNGEQPRTTFNRALFSFPGITSAH